MMSYDKVYDFKLFEKVNGSLKSDRINFYLLKHLLSFFYYY